MEGLQFTHSEERKTEGGNKRYPGIEYYWDEIQF